MTAIRANVFKKQLKKREHRRSQISCRLAVGILSIRPNRNRRIGFFLWENCPMKFIVTLLRCIFAYSEIVCPTMRKLIQISSTRLRSISI